MKAVSNGKVSFENFDGDNDQLKLNDLKLFVKAFECKYLFDTFDNSDESKTMNIDSNNNDETLIKVKSSDDEKILVVSLVNDQVKFSRKNGDQINKISCAFSKSVAEFLTKMLDENNPFELKPAIESMKLNVKS